jgi:hypothetical protein
MVVALVVQYSFAAPVLDQSHIVTQSVGGLITVHDYTPAQTFTVGAQGTLSQIDVQIGRDAGALDNLSLEIWATSGGLPIGAAPLFSTGIPVASVPVAGPSANLPFTSVNLSAGNLQVTPGQTYAAALRGVPDFGEPNAFWNWGSPSYSGGNPVSSAFGGAWQVESSTYDFGFKTWVTPPPAPAGPPGPSYSLFETAAALPKSSGPFLVQPIDSTHYQGVNFEVVRPTRLSSLGGYLYGGTGQIFGAVVKLNDLNGAPNPTSFTGADVLATTLINAPGGANLADVTTPIDVTLQPGFYGFWLGSGKFGATGQSDMYAQNVSDGSWYTWSMSQPSGTRNFGNSTLRFIANASSDSGTVQLRPTVDGEADLTNGSYVVKDTSSNINVSRTTDHRALMEFSLANVPAHALVTSATLQIDVRQFQSNAGSYPHLLVYGYAGNGQLTAADATASSTLIGTSPDIAATDLVTINLNPTYIQSLLGTSSYLGLLGLGDLNNLGFSFLPKETSGFGEAAFLSLSVSVPGDYNGDLHVDATDYGLWRSNFGSTTNLSADANKNGKIDAADYLIWRKNRSASGAGSGNLAAAVPEPSTLLLVAMMLPGLFGSRPRRRLAIRGISSV